MATSTVATFIALLRGINVSGRNKIPMPELRSLCAEIGWQDVQSHIQSGNLVFRASARSAVLESELERAIERRFRLTIPVIVRSAADWPAYVNGNPYTSESRMEPNHVMLVLTKALPKSDAAGELQKRAANGERVVQVGDALWAYYAHGVGVSKLSPSLFDRLVGSPVTARNWNTVLELDEMSRRAE
jgi:uncharacterized protein (DUF1697 family)